MRDEAMRPRPLCMSAQRHANEPRDVLVESQVIMPIGIGTLAAPSLVLARSPRRRRCVGGAAEAGRDADPRAGAGASVEADAGGGEVPSAAEIAEAEGVTRSFVNRLLRLTLLAPDIVEAIPEGGGRRGCCWRQVPVSRRIGQSRRRGHPPAAAHPAGAAYR